MFHVRSRYFSLAIFSKRLPWNRILHCSLINGISKCPNVDDDDDDCGKKNDVIKIRFFPLHSFHFRNRDYSNVPYSGYYKFLTPAINLRDADLIKDILIKDHFNFHINEQQFDEKTDPLMILNPFGAKDDIWRKARTVLTPLLTLFKVNLYDFFLKIKI